MGLGVLDKSHNKSHSQDDECEGIAMSKKGQKKGHPEGRPVLRCLLVWNLLRASLAALYSFRSRLTSSIGMSLSQSITRSSG